MRPKPKMKVLVLTGAGISVASGIRTFTGKNGMANDPDVLRLSQHHSLGEDLPGVWKLFSDLRRQVLQLEPNAAHKALARFEQRLTDGQDLLIVTMNIDGLHQKAGNSKVLEFHGSLLRTRCISRHCQTRPFADQQAYDGEVPLCPHCGSLLRPDVVFFGERIPATQRLLVQDWLRECDVFISAGTSDKVRPAAGFARVAREHGALTVHLNVEPAPAAQQFEREVLGKAEETLPEILAELLD